MSIERVVFAFTGYCPLAYVLKKSGLPSAPAFK